MRNGRFCGRLVWRKKMRAKTEQMLTHKGGHAKLAWPPLLKQKLRELKKQNIQFISLEWKKGKCRLYLAQRILIGIFVDEHSLNSHGDRLWFDERTSKIKSHIMWTNNQNQSQHNMDIQSAWSIFLLHEFGSWASSFDWGPTDSKVSKYEHVRTYGIRILGKRCTQTEDVLNFFVVK